MKENLPKFFGFEGIGILLRDLKTNEYFTLSENLIDIDENEVGAEFREGTIIKFPP